MLRFFSSRNLSFTVTVHKWHEPYVVQQFSTKPLHKYQMIPAAAQRRRHRGDRWNFSLQFSLQTLCLEFLQIFTKNDVLFCNMAIAMNSWTWSPRVGFRIFVGIALGCFQVRRNVPLHCAYQGTIDWSNNLINQTFFLIARFCLLSTSQNNSFWMKSTKTSPANMWTLILGMNLLLNIAFILKINTYLWMLAN